MRGVVTVTHGEIMEAMGVVLRNRGVKVNAKNQGRVRVVTVRAVTPPATMESMTRCSQPAKPTDPNAEVLIEIDFDLDLTLPDHAVGQ